uniref:uncharacterized protein n=1 Tax=Pristiophorus japonicus TaxID=55135 RepID=UPI00398EC9B6
MHPLTPLEMRVAGMIGAGSRRSTTLAQAVPSYPREYVAHASMNEGQSLTVAPEPVDDEQDLSQHDEDEDEDEDEEEEANRGEQEDAVINESVTLNLEEVPEDRHVPSPFVDATLEATFCGYPASDVAASPMIPTPRVRVTRGRRPQHCCPEMHDTPEVVEPMGMSGERIELTRSLIETMGEMRGEIAGLSAEVAGLPGGIEATVGGD